MARPIYRQFVELGDVASVRRFQARHRVIVKNEDQDAVRAVLERWDRVRVQEWNRLVRPKRVGRTARAEVSREQRSLARAINRRLEVTVRLTGDLAGLAVESNPTGSVAAPVWLALALAIVGKGAQRDCLACGALFTPSRADARFCSGACRVRAHRDTYAGD